MSERVAAGAGTAAPPSHDPPLRLPRRARDSHKGDYGRVLAVGGSRGMAGAISLTAISALRTGSGLVTVVVPDRCLETVASFNPCLMTRPLDDSGAGQFGGAAADALAAMIDGVDAIAIGPGMGQGAGSNHMVHILLDRPVPRVFDADALNILSGMDNLENRLGGPCVLTPHPGEWQRFCRVSANDRDGQWDAARRFAARRGVVVLLKGSETLVTDGSREYANRTGNPGMATGGSGDCLTGVIASLLGHGLSPWDATVLAAWVHGTAGDLAAEELGMAGIIASDIVDRLPRAVEMATEAAAGPMPAGPRTT